MNTELVLAAEAISAPDLDYWALLPMLILFGVACVGVAVRGVPAAGAAAPAPGRPRARRTVRRVHLRGVAGPRRHGRQDRRYRRGRRRAGAVHAGQHHPARLRQHPADRRAGAGDGRRVRGQRGGHRRHDDRPQARRLRVQPHRGVPAGALRDRRHDAVRRVERPAADVRRAGSAVAAALPAVRARAAPPAPLPGSRGQVLPPRRVRVGVLPVRAGAHLRLLGRRRPARDPRLDRLVRAGADPAAARPGDAPHRPAVQGRRRAVPPVDAGRLPGRADPDHRAHGRLHQGRRVRRDPARPLRRLLQHCAGTGVRC